MLSLENETIIKEWCQSNGTNPNLLDEDDKHAIISIVKSDPQWLEWFLL